MVLSEIEYFGSTRKFASPPVIKTLCERIKSSIKMYRIAVFGKPGGGKSTLSKKLSVITGIKLYALDSIKYKQNGAPVSPEEFSKRHGCLMDLDSWIIDGFGTLESFWLRIEAADTLVFVDLPYRVHYWRVTKRMLKGIFVKPEGWPEECSVFKGTLQSFKNLKLSPKFWTPELFEEIKLRGKNKNIYRITSVKEFNSFVKLF